MDDVVFEPRLVESAGRTVTVREAVTDDAPRLLDLYQRLGPDDLRRRFFSTFRPDRGFVENWLDRSHQGGAILVAVEGDADSGTIIGDAGWIPTGSDVAELAITVDPDRRGWLGPYLLDALVEHAGIHGVRVLEAEVLTTNCGMIAMLKARGCSFRPGDDLSVARIEIGTTGAAPGWPEDAPHPRVLVEGSSAAWQGVRAAERAGLGVRVCPGPEHGRLRACPLLSGGSCPLVDGADAVVVALSRSARTTSALLDAHGERDVDQPIAVAPPLRHLYGDPPRRNTFIVDPDAPGDEAVDALLDALGGAERPSGADAVLEVRREAGDAPE